MCTPPASLKTRSANGAVASITMFAIVEHEKNSQRSQAPQQRRHDVAGLNRQAERGCDGRRRPVWNPRGRRDRQSTRHRRTLRHRVSDGHGNGRLSHASGTDDGDESLGDEVGGDRSYRLLAANHSRKDRRQEQRRRVRSTSGTLGAGAGPAAASRLTAPRSSSPGRLHSRCTGLSRRDPQALCADRSCGPCRLLGFTTRSRHTRAINSRWLTTSPARSTSTMRMSSARLPSASGTPSFSNARAAGNSRNGPNEMMSPCGPFMRRALGRGASDARRKRERIAGPPSTTAMLALSVVLSAIMCNVLCVGAQEQLDREGARRPYPVRSERLAPVPAVVLI